MYRSLPACLIKVRTAWCLFFVVPNCGSPLELFVRSCTQGCREKMQAGQDTDGCGWALGIRCPLKTNIFLKRNVCARCGARGDIEVRKTEDKLVTLHKLSYSHLLRTRIFVTEFTKSPVRYPANRVHTLSSFRNHFNIIRPFPPGDVFVWWWLRITKVARRRKYCSDLIFGLLSQQL